MAKNPRWNLKGDRDRVRSLLFLFVLKRLNHAKFTAPIMEDKTLQFINKRRIMMYRQMINFIELMVVSLMALVATSISRLTWYQTVGMFFAAVFMLFISIELECGESKKEEL